MESQPRSATVSKKRLWAGYILSALVSLLLCSSATVKFMKPPSVVQELGRLGYHDGMAIGIGILELFCTIVYVIPRTSVLGAILLTAYLGGATATHVRIGDPFFGPVIAGILAWAGIFAREKRLEALVPLRKKRE